MTTPVNATLPPPPSIDEVNRKIAFSRWRRNGGNPEQFIQEHQAKSQEEIEKKVSEVTTVLRTQQQASQSVITEITQKLSAADVLAASKEKEAALKSALEVLKEANSSLTEQLSDVQSSLSELSSHKKGLIHQLKKVKQQKKDASFRGEETLYSLGQRACQSVSNQTNK